MDRLLNYQLLSMILQHLENSDNRRFDNNIYKSNSKNKFQNLFRNNQSNLITEALNEV